jgi:G protein beta subunit-like protein
VRLTLGKHSINCSDAPQASSDHTARLWEMASGETVRQYNGHHKGLFPMFLEDVYLIENLLAAVCCALHDGAG